MSLFNSSDPPFNWCHLKLARAREHMEAINNEIQAWKEKKSYILANERNAEMTRYSVVARSLGAPPLEHLAVVAADCFHSLRTTLDQFIYAVAIHQSKTDPPPDANRLQFPICDTPDQFNDEVKRHIRSLSTPVRTAIESVQPYKRPHYAIPPLLAVIRDFDNTDKHRLLQVALMQPAHGGFENISGIAPGQPVELFFNTNSLNDGTEIAALILDRPTPNVRYDFRLTMHVAIGHAPGPTKQDRTALQGLIGDLIAEVEAVMLKIYVAL